MRHRLSICVIGTLVILAGRATQAFPPAKGEAPETFVLKPGGWVYKTDPLNPRVRFGVRTGVAGRSDPMLGPEIEVRHGTPYNSLGQQRTVKWIADCPRLNAGMIVPLFGVVGKLHDAGPHLAFTRIPEADLPPGVEYTGTGFPLFLGIDWDGAKVSRIATDSAGDLFAEVIQTRGGPSDMQVFRQSVGSILTIEHRDTMTRMRVEQIVAPDPQLQVPGWITLRLAGSGIESRRPGPAQIRIPDTLTILDARKVTGVILSSATHPYIQFAGGMPPAPPKASRSLATATFITTNATDHLQTLDACLAWYPGCEAGMLLPVCGGVGRIESIGDAGIKFKMLSPEQLPSGITGNPEDPPLFLGALRHDGLLNNDLRVDRIGIDDKGVLSADLTQTRNDPDDAKQKVVRDKFSGLALQSTFVLRDDRLTAEYRVTEIVAPNAENKIPGWIKLRPIGDGLQEVAGEREAAAQ